MIASVRRACQILNCFTQDEPILSQSKDTLKDWVWAKILCPSPSFWTAYGETGV